MDLSGILAAAQPGGGTQGMDSKQLGQDYNQFLRLLTTQLQHQDPLSPMDTAEFTSQLVQFSSVEQQIKGNDYLQKLLTLNTLSLTGIGLGYVGLKVFSPGSEFQFDGATSAALSYNMPAGAKVGTLSIIDATGQTVYTSAADLSEGTHNLYWDGRTNDGYLLPPGKYEIRVGAQDEQGNALNVQTFTSGIVTGVETGENGDVALIIDERLVPVTSVRQATLPVYAYNPPAEETPAE